MNAERNSSSRRTDAMRNDYVSPELNVTQLYVEGVLCASGETEDYDYYEFEW